MTHSFSSRFAALRSGRLGLGVAAALGLALGLVVLPAEADDRGGERGGFSTDPTVGTLPLTTGGVPDVAGPDQVVYLTGEVEALRRALAAVDVRWQAGESGSGVWALPDGRAWVEFHGNIALHWSDAALLEGLEVGVGAGFEGGGLVCSVESAFGVTTPALLEVGRTLPVSLTRLFDAGLLQTGLVLHGLHRNGQRSQVSFAAVDGGLTIQQTL